MLSDHSALLLDIVISVSYLSQNSIVSCLSYLCLILIVKYSSSTITIRTNDFFIHRAFRQCFAVFSFTSSPSCSPPSHFKAFTPLSRLIEPCTVCIGRFTSHQNSDLRSSCQIKAISGSNGILYSTDSSCFFPRKVSKSIFVPKV